MDKHLHIVCFDAPAPPDYGGSIDVYYKIAALAKAGVEITLHYFNYKAERGHEDLEPYCKEIFVYTRKRPWQCLHTPLPYIVASWINKQLIERLNKDDHPVLLEGIHCTGIIPFLKKDRTILVRLHNNEASYYQRLAQNETAPFKNLYYVMESNRLERYQHRLPKNLQYAAIAQTDATVFKEKYGLAHVQLIPSFVPWHEVQVPTGMGGYCLYHGNLSVSENNAVASWLLKHVFSEATIPFIIAGKNAPPKLQEMAARHQHVQLVNSPSHGTMEQLILGAQVHVLPSLNDTGVKLKLLHALFRGRHCLTNAPGVAGSGLESLVHISDEADSMQNTISNLMQREITEKEMLQRTETLQHLYTNIKNADALIAWIWKHYL